MTNRTLNLNLTKAAIAEHKENLSVRELSDTTSTLRFRYHKDRNYGSFHSVLYRHGKAIWSKLGGYPELSPAQAKTHLGTYKSTGKMNLLKTVGEVVEAHLEEVRISTSYNLQNKRSIESVCKHLAPIYQEKISNLTSDLFKRLISIPMEIEGHKLSYINQVFKRLRAALNSQKRLYLNDALNQLIWKEVNSKEIKHKEGKLTVGDLDHVVSLINESPELKAAQVLFKLLLLHGTRIGETRQLTWRMIDFRNKVIRIPAGLTKTDVDLNIPMTGHVEDMLRQYKTACRCKVYLFSARQGKPISHNTAYNYIKRIVTTGDIYFNAHDLRKLFSSTIGEKGYGDEATEMILNHSLGAMRKTYNNFEGMEKKRKTLEQYHNLLKNTYLLKFVTKTTARQTFEALAQRMDN